MKFEAHCDWGFSMATSVFMSHTKLDKEFCDKFDIAAARIGIEVFRSELEDISPPAWKNIKQKMEQSSAMFLLVGKRLVEAQAMSEFTAQYREEWKHTQNWIAYEVGLACQKAIDVWVICDSVYINFPVPYLNNYVIYGLEQYPADQKLLFIRDVLSHYKKNEIFPLGALQRAVTCPNVSCGAQYNLHSMVQKGGNVPCPTCLRPMLFPNGWLL
jgi:hypothetical protein